MGIDNRKPDGEAVPRFWARLAGSGSLAVFLGPVGRKNGEVDPAAVFAILQGAIFDVVSKRVASLGLAGAIDQPSWTGPFEVVNRFTAADAVAPPSWLEIRGPSVIQVPSHAKLPAR